MSLFEPHTPLPAGFDYQADFVQDHESLERVLWKRLDWFQQEIMMFGKPVLQPRLVAWYAEAGVDYGYSGIRLQPRAFPAPLDMLRERLFQALGQRFNSVLCNGYRDGSDSMGWHADDEPELGPRPLIASVSLGQTRRFRIRSRVSKESVGLDLEPGSLLLMHGHSQRDYQHALPKTRRAVGRRINLTFRQVLS
ncbi:MAG: alpha-ketoglutarate-dependent dioxygenase AlkB [Xanthomonadales bacterium]|nr:alpha-ketoglutarate-dependent dioxygenase AlkB [Xanthomonadales bacterium]